MQQIQAKYWVIKIRTQSLSRRGMTLTRRGPDQPAGGPAPVPESVGHALEALGYAE